MDRTLCCRSLGQWFQANSEFIDCRLVVYNYSVNPYFSITDVKLMSVEISSTPSWL